MVADRARARIVLTVAAVVIGCTAVGAPLLVKSGAATDPCQLLSQEEIEKVFGGTVSDGRRGLTAAEKSQCEYSIGAADEDESAFDEPRPGGVLIVVIVPVRAKTAYDNLRKTSADYQAIDELPNALYNPGLSSVDVLAGDVLLTVQGLFMPEELVPVPAHLCDVRSDLIQLAKLAVKRL